MIKEIIILIYKGLKSERCPECFNRMKPPYCKTCLHGIEDHIKDNLKREYGEREYQRVMNMNHGI